MVKTLIEIALLLVTSATTLAAFGGKTWKEGTEPILERITPRGWLALLCLVLSLSFGATKVMLTKSGDDKKTADTAADRVATETRETAYKNEAKSAAEKLAAEVTISNLEKQAAVAAAKATQDRLDASQALLSAVQNDLTSTRGVLTEQNQANLVSVIANADLKVRAIVLFIPFRKAIPRTDQIRNAILPHFGVDVCDDLTAVDIAVPTKGDHFEHIAHGPDDGTSELDYVSGDYKITTGMVDFSDDDDATGLFATMQMSASNGYMYYARLDLRNKPTSAAQLLGIINLSMKPPSWLLTHQKAPVTVSAVWPRKPKFGIKGTNIGPYSKLWERQAVSTEGATEAARDLVQDLNQHPYPPDCSIRLKQRLGSAFESASLGLMLDGPQHQGIVFRLKALAPSFAHQMWSVSFVAAGPPSIASFSDELMKDIYEEKSSRPTSPHE